MKWSIREEGFDKEKIPALENRFLCGNGYLGIRGALEEYGKEQMPAINLAGIFDQVKDGWREPLNAPNGLYAYIMVDGIRYGVLDKEPLEHEQTLNFRHGIFARKTRWKTGRGIVTVETERFADRSQVHQIISRYTVTADFHGEIEIHTGIDGDVWDIHGPHYGRMIPGQNQELLWMTAVTWEKRERVTVMETIRRDFPCETHLIQGEKEIMQSFSFVSEIGRPCSLEKAIVVFTTRDSGWDQKRGEELLEQFQEQGYEAARKIQIQSWEKKWQVSQVEIDGDEDAMEALNYSIYHLLSIAPTHASDLSIPARGLSGQTYKGAVFWDTEMFMLDFFLFTDPAVAESLMRYRISTLEGAKKKAAEYGYEGAFYAWESQEGGYDACSDYNVVDVFTGRPMRTYFKDKQYHISAAVAYGILRYVEVTGDESLLREGGMETVVECARFYYSLLLRRANGKYYEIHDVIGPDEYHERVNNNAYTNRMAKFTLEAATALIERQTEILGTNVNGKQEIFDIELEARFQEAAEVLYQPQPDQNGIIPQFDGYEKLENATLAQVRGRLLHEKEYWGGAYGVAAGTKVIKQADVVAMLNLFSPDYSQKILKANWEYYEPRTEHGSSLSSCMYAMLACKCGQPQRAYPFFQKSARADLDEGGKEWAGLVYIGGTHPAAAGGAYMTAVEGFGGVSVWKGELQIRPCLPDGWKRMRFSLYFKGKRRQVEVQNGKVYITMIDEE